MEYRKKRPDTEHRYLRGAYVSIIHYHCGIIKQNNQKNEYWINDISHSGFMSSFSGIAAQKTSAFTLPADPDYLFAI